MSSGVMFEPKVPLIGPIPTQAFAETSNGCSCSPDGIPGVVSWLDACILHDWHYTTGAGVSRFKADYYLMMNMVRCGAPPRLAVWYFIGTRLGGWRCYRKGEEEDLEE